MKKKKDDKCKFEVGFNALGMPIFECITHRGKGKKRRLTQKCALILIEKFEKFVNKR